MQKIYFLKLNRLSWTESDESKLKYLSPERAASVKRYKLDIDKLLSLYAALTTRKILCDALNADNSALKFEAVRNHKPKLISPESRIDFNFAHTRNAILIGISDECNIGVDIERLDKRAPLNVSEIVFHPAEISYINSSDSDKQLRFFECWTRKEAYTKMLGLGLVADLTSINTLDGDIAATLITQVTDKYIWSVSSNASLDGIELEVMKGM